MLHRAPRLPRLARDVDHRIPALAIQLAEGVEPVAVAADEARAIRHRPGLAAREGRHLVPARDRLTNDFGTEPSGAPEHEDAHAPRVGWPHNRTWAACD